MKEIKDRIPEPVVKGARCPACHGATVNRDVSSEDGYYVEYCYGGTVFITVKDGDGKERRMSEPCEYWGTGWVTKWKR